MGVIPLSAPSSEANGKWSTEEGEVGGRGEGGNPQICCSRHRRLTMMSLWQLLTLTPALRLTESGHCGRGGGRGEGG